ncbi:MAG: methyltransferase [Pseudomonadota bacterium]
MTTTVDAFLGGKLSLEQPKDGYRAGVDPVLLAAATPAQPGDCVLDLGCGVGTAGLCLAARVPVQVWGVDLDPSVVALAQANAARNSRPMHITQGDATARPTPFYDRSFDIVLTNPPFFVPQTGPVAQNKNRATGRAGDVDLAAWIATAYKRLRPRGRFVLIQRMDRLPDVLRACDGFGDVQVLPIAGRSGRAPDHFLLRARKDAKAPFRMLPPLVMHKDPSQNGDGSTYTPNIEAVLRFGAALTWDD